MPTSADTRSGSLRPGRLFAIVLAAVFAIETLLMIVLPEVLPDRHRDWLMVLADGLVLTAVLAPILWVAVIRPLQQLVVIRTGLLRRVLTIQEEERGRVAREMHDGLGQSLTSMLVGLRAVEELTVEPLVKRHLEDLRRIASATHDEVRRIARGLRPSALDDVGLMAALERLSQDVSAATAGQVEVVVAGGADGPAIRLESAVETACFRIVQEATANAIRHGGARRIRVTVARRGAVVELSIEDNGRGAAGAVTGSNAAASRDTTFATSDFATPAEQDVAVHPIDQASDCRFEHLGRPASGEAAPADAFGFWSIRERVALLSGTLEARSLAGQGMLLLCRFPSMP
jgi:signal transduction histidine kinase